MPEIKGLAVTASSQTASLAALIATASSSYWPDPKLQPISLRSGEYGVTVLSGVTSSNGPLITVTYSNAGSASQTFTVVTPNNANFR